MKWLVTIEYESVSDDAAYASADLRTALPESARITTVQRDPFSSMADTKQSTDRLLSAMERLVPPKEDWRKGGGE